MIQKVCCVSGGTFFKPVTPCLFGGTKKTWLLKNGEISTGASYNDQLHKLSRALKEKRSEYDNARQRIVSGSEIFENIEKWVVIFIAGKDEKFFRVRIRKIPES